MNEKSQAGKVGLFIFIGIVLIAALMMNFSRGVGLFKPKYELHMRVRSVAGLKESSAVFLSGVKIGNVQSIDLDTKNKGVVVHLTILKEFPLHKDSRFGIEQQGVLGDQFVNIRPGTPESPMLEDGAEVAGEDPFNLQEVAYSASELLKRFDQLGASVNEAVQRVNKQVLDTNTLRNLSGTIANFHTVSEHTLQFIDSVQAIVSNNTPTIAMSLTNLHNFSRRLEVLAMDIDETIVTNRVELNESMKNLRDATASLKLMASDLQSGKGLVGGLFKDEELRAQAFVTISNLSMLSSNLNRHGLLYKPKIQTKAAPGAPAYTGKSGFK